MMRNLVRIRCCVVLQESNCHYAGSLALPVPGRQISGYPPASGSTTALTWTLSCHLFLVASLGASSSAFSYLARFLARLVGCFHFHFVGSLTIGLAMGGAESREADIAVSFSS